MSAMTFAPCRRFPQRLSTALQPGQRVASSSRHSHSHKKLLEQARTLSSSTSRSSTSPSQLQGQDGKKSGRAARRTVFSGIQPTGIPHLGNYLGAIQNWIRLQNDPERYLPNYTPDPSGLPPRIFYSIVGLHAITMPQDPKTLKRERMDALACLLACGIGNEGAVLFFQEEVPEHAELAWYLNTLTSVGRLQRMTTWKSKLSIAGASTTESMESSSDHTSIEDLSLSERLRQEEQLKLGLLAYPVLQTADVLLYKSTDIPVGEDQQQHLELARGIAESFNHRFGRTFPLPRHMITPSKRVLSLSDPTQKMSKSAPNPSSRILITDSPSAITKKIRSAVTDQDRTVTYDPENRRGVANLLTILAACKDATPTASSSVSAAGTSDASLDTNEWTPEQVVEELRAQGISGHAQLKSIVAEAVIEKLKGIREEYERLRADTAYLRDVASAGRNAARTVAAETMTEVRRKVGLDQI